MVWPATPDKTPRRSSYRKIVSTALKAAVSLALLTLLFRRAELGEVWQTLIAAQPGLLALSALVFLGLQGLAVYRWKILSGVMGFERSIIQYARYYFIGLFFNLFLPTTVGGDVGRFYYLAGERQRLVSAAMTILADRGCAVVSSAAIASVVLLIGTPVWIPSWISWTVWGGTAVLLVGLIAPFLFPSVFRNRGFPVQYWEQPRSLFAALGLSLAMGVIWIAVVRLLGESLRLDISGLFYFVLTPLATIMGAVPISLNGLGVREGAVVYLLLLAGADQVSAIALALLWLMLILLFGLIGGVVWILTPRSAVRLNRT
jgi:glycosyltransferase 2 family protein